MTPTVDFDPSDITNDALAELRRLTISRILNEAPVLGAWLHKWCDDEQMRRHRNEAGFIRVVHELCLPPCPRWPSEDLADALTAITVLSYVTDDEGVGRLADRLAIAIAEEAATRLRKI